MFFRTLLLASATVICLAAQPLRFRERVLATDLDGGYQVVASDVNGDGRTDLIALGSRTPDLVWFESPDWKRHVIAGPFDRMINLAAYDIDGDHVPEIVLAAGFSNEAKKSTGIVYRLHHRGDPRDKWEATEIDRLPASHRLRVVKLGKDPVFVNAPLTAPDTQSPDYRGATPLVFYRPGEWTRQVISMENQGVVHGLEIADWDGDGRDDILTAGFEGVYWFRNTGRQPWPRQLIVKGDLSPWPKSGASEIAIGKLRKDRFLATIEPWHGHQVCVYTTNRGGQWERHVIDDSQTDVHAVRVRDLNGDGLDDIVATVRGPRKRVTLYMAADTGGARWERIIVDDGGLAAADCAIADLNGDKIPDLACIGGSSLKLYENLGGSDRRAR